MQLLELFPTMVGVFEYEEFEADAPAWRVSVADAVAERESMLGTPQHQTGDRLHERPEFAVLMAFFRQCCGEYMAGLRYRSELELRLQCCWATVVVGGDRFEVHQHANSFLSGAFYLDVEPDAKPVSFRDPRPQSRTSTSRSRRHCGSIGGTTRWDRAMGGSSSSRPGLSTGSGRACPQCHGPA